MKRLVGLCVLGLSASGYPLTQGVIRRWGRRGAVVVEAVSVGLAIRDASMVAAGAPGRLRPVPGILLRLELAAAVATAIAGLYPLRRQAEKDNIVSAGSRGADLVRRIALMTLFGLHTIRFAIYLAPGEGRRKAA